MKAAETSTLAIALALGAQAGAQSAPQTPQTTFRSSVELVEVDDLGAGRELHGGDR